jgi:hypothetical protein
MSDDLPDGRARSRRRFYCDGRWYVPVYCVNCGARQGVVPEVLVMHCAALCDTGSGCQKHASEFSAMSDPNAARDEALAFETGKLASKLGRPATLADLERIADESSTSPIAAIARDHRWAVGRTT